MDNDIKNRLLQLSETDYKQFSSSLIPGVQNLLGVRLPALRNLSKEISKDDWRTVLNSDECDFYFEETMLRGMIIGCANMPFDERISYVEDFVGRIDNWSVCDSFCAGLKFVKKHKKDMWNFILPYLSSDKEFEVRFAVSMIIDHFIIPEYIENVLIYLDNVKQDGYYAKMAVAWAVSVCFVKFPDLTFEYLKSSSLDDFTFNKALQKATESNRVDKETKAIIRSMKR